MKCSSPLVYNKNKKVSWPSRLVCGEWQTAFLRRWALWPSAPVPTVRDLMPRPRGVAAEASTSPQARAWQPSLQRLGRGNPRPATGTAWAPLPVTAPVEVPSTLGKPSPTTQAASPKHPGHCGFFFGKSTLPSHGWSLQSTRSLPRPPPARSPVTWLGKLWGSSSPADSLAKPTAGPRPESPPPAARLPSKALGSSEPSLPPSPVPSLPSSQDQAGCSQGKQFGF